MRHAMILPSILVSTLLSGCVYIASDEAETNRPHRMQAAEPAMHADHTEHMQRHRRTVVQSDADFEVTRTRLHNAITSRGLTLFDEIDHQANAAGANLNMGPNTVFIFGNPKAGTALMNANPEFGLDLPMRALVYETADGIFVTSVNIDRMMHHNHVEGLDQLRGNVAGVLSGIIAEAAGGAS